MLIDMTCACGASFTIESDEHDTLTMLWAQRFMKSHEECGFMSREVSESQEKYTRLNINYKEKREKEL